MRMTKLNSSRFWLKFSMTCCMVSAKSMSSYRWVNGCGFSRRSLGFSPDAAMKVLPMVLILVTLRKTGFDRSSSKSPTSSLRTRRNSLPPSYDSSYISWKLTMLAKMIPASRWFSEYLDVFLSCSATWRGMMLCRSQSAWFFIAWIRCSSRAAIALPWKLSR
uniref:Uncharacterized protein n=1 Tax=Ixodes ricinus TaxID=34613 RepID=A0A6B0UWU9_IXORI